MAKPADQLAGTRVRRGGRAMLREVEREATAGHDANPGVVHQASPDDGRDPRRGVGNGDDRHWASRVDRDEEARQLVGPPGGRLSDAPRTLGALHFGSPWWC